MSSTGSQLSSALGITAFVSFYGIACLLVWVLGPSIGFGISGQIILIALILITLPFAILINHYRKKRALKKETAAQAPAGNEGAQQTSKTPVAPRRVYDELLRGVEEAVQWLRSTRLAGSKSNDAVYALPWFLVAGPSSSGKTSLLLSSGLDFHPLPSQRRSELRIVRPTRYSEWRMTDSAVLVDTAGRYQSDGPAREEWLALAETIKKHRANRPLDGVLLVVSAERVLHSNDAEIEQQAKTIRARLDELIHLARARFPVYLVFTNMDRLSGFSEFFNVADGEGSAQVWGATIPLEKAVNAHALFDVEFDQLCDSLARQRLLRLRKPAKPEIQLRIFDFPLRFGEARNRLGLFTSALFRPNPFSESPLLRGFYFTANFSEPTPARAIAEEEEAERTAQAVGEGYFTYRLFKDVVLQDKDLATSFQTTQKRPPRWRVVLVAAAAVLMLCLSVAAASSFFGNRRFIAEATERGSLVEEIARESLGKDPTTKEAAAARVEIEAIESLRETVSQLDAYDRDSAPLQLRFGLYSGGALNESLRQIYFDAIDQRYVKPAVAALQRDLQSFAAGTTANPAVATAEPDQGTGSSTEDVLGRYYDLLKAYLMLAQSDKVEPTFLANQLQEYWKKSSPPDMEIVSQRQLDFFARQAGYNDAPHSKADDKLVAGVRQKLVAYPPVNRFYKRVLSEINARTTPINLESILQGRGGGVLAGTYTVPGSFTVDGYRNHMLPAIDSAAEDISKDDWVMGSVASSAQPGNMDISNLRDMYLREYTDQWRRFLRSITVQQFRGPDDAAAALKALSSTNSPMERVMETVATNTNLSAKAESHGVWAWIKGLFSSATRNDTGGATEVEREFRPLFQFVSSGDNKKDASPMSEYRAELRRLLDPIEAAPPDRLAEIQKAVSSGKDEIGLQKADQTIGRLLDGFKTAAGTDAAALLKQPLGSLKRFFYGGAYQQIEKEWTDQIYQRAHALEAGYPFTPGGQSSVTDLALFLNPANGQLTNFYARLASSFEGSPGAWRLKESAPFKFSDDFVKYLNDAGRLRDSLFANGDQEPEVSYQLELQPVPNAGTMITIDGTPLEAHGTSAASAKFSWPAKTGSSGAKITVTSGTETLGEKSFNGDWGLFRMFDAGSPTQSAGSAYVLTWNLDSVTVRATLTPASSTKNPFDRRVFTNLHAPQSIEK